MEKSKRKMPVLVKILIIIAIPVLIVLGFRLKNTIWPPEASGEVNISQMLSLQSSSEDMGELTYKEKRLADVNFINKKNEVETRQIVIYIPETADSVMPLIFIPHYPADEGTLELRQYLNEGWMVASGYETNDAYNAGTLTDDDLVFNNAALYYLRNLDEVDSNRIAVVGGSAGGYTALMLSGLQMGTCTTIATAPITNVYFNFYQYFPASKEINQPNMGKALLSGFWKKLTVPGYNGGVLDSLLNAYPMPWLGMVTDQFLPVKDNFPDVDDYDRWAALSPIGLAETYSSPFTIIHCTSDVLVPVGQTSKQCVYEDGDNVPDGYSSKLPENNPGILGHSLEEMLDADMTSVNIIPLMTGDLDLPYKDDRMFNLDIFDDGATDAQGSHSAGRGTGNVLQIAYLKAMFEKTLSGTEILRDGKILLLLDRYLGNSVQLPAHEGVDNSAYGSLVVYRQEIIEEFSQYALNHSVEELDAAVLSAIENADNSSKLTAAWKDIKNHISE